MKRWAPWVCALTIAGAMWLDIAYVVSLGHYPTTHTEQGL